MSLPSCRPAPGLGPPCPYLPVGPLLEPPCPYLPVGPLLEPPCPYLPVGPLLVPPVDVPVDDRSVKVLRERLLGRRRQQRERLVGDVQLDGRVAVDVEPPVADERHLAEDGAVRTQERVLVAVLVTVVPHLRSEDWGGVGARRSVMVRSVTEDTVSRWAQASSGEWPALRISDAAQGGCR